MKKKIVVVLLLVLFVVLVVTIAINRIFYVKSFYNNVTIAKVVISLSDVKAGLTDTQVKTILTTDEKEIEEISNVLKQRTLLKAFSLNQIVNPNSNDRFELRITLTSDENKNLEYLITSEGNVFIAKNNDKFSNTIVLSGNVINWYDDLIAFFNVKEQSVNWSNL